MIIIDGPRNVGKTYLLNSAGVDTFKLSFAKMDRTFDLKDRKERGFGFGLGKDLMLLYLNKKLNLDIVVDRLFLSSAVFSVLDLRCTLEYSRIYIDYIIENKLLDNVTILFIEGADNPHNRGKKDKWDSVAYNDQLKIYYDLLKKINLGNVMHFKNNFDEDSVKSFKKLMRSLL